MKKMLSFMLLFSLPGLIFAKETRPAVYQVRDVPSFAYYAPQLSQAVRAFLQVPECRELLEQAQKEGKIGLKWDSLGTQNSHAAWFGDRRLIALNSSRSHSEGQKICSIVFELHNAVNNYKFLQIDQLAKQGKIDKDTYVESIERLEHQNAINTKRVLDKGIRLGVFPSDTGWPIIHSFDDHYKVQQLMGHSTQICQVYDLLNPQGQHPAFSGTISNLKRLSEQDRKKMLQYISMKDNLEYGNSYEKEQARRLLHQTYREIQFKPYSHKGHENNHMIVLNEVFEGNPAFEKMRNTR